jgi:glutamyl-tRNA reductase
MPFGPECFSKGAGCTLVAEANAEPNPEVVVKGLLMVGVSHRGAPLNLLERMSVRREDRPDLRAALRALGFDEAVVLSTCSRVEIYCKNLSPAAADPVKVLIDALEAHSGVNRDELGAAVEVRTSHAAVEHLFSVTAGLQSRLLGEAEILAQTQVAFRESQSEGMTGSLLGRLFPAAMRSGRQVHALTSLGEFARSLGHQAVDVGLASLGRTPDPAVLVVGSGQMARAAVDQLTARGLRPTVAARDAAYAARLAGTGAVCPMPALARGIAQADLLICTTSAAQHVVTVDHVARAMAGRARPLAVVDLSVPRNVNAEVAHIPGVTLIDVEGLADDGTKQPRMAAALATATDMASAAARRFSDAVAARDAGPVIAAVRSRVEDICRTEALKSARPDAVDPDAIARLTHSIAGKLLHGPTMAARHAAAAGDAAGLRQLCEMFGVPPGDVGLAEPIGEDQRLAG